MLFKKSISCLQSLITKNNRHIIATRIRITPINVYVIDGVAVSNRQLPDIEAIIHSDTNKVFI
jgi:hypothetical protein